MPIPQFRAFLALVALWFAAPCPGQTVFINEIHYDNTGGDEGEFVEIAGPAGTNLSGYELVFYNGSGGADYDSDVLSGTIPNEGSGFGAIAFFVEGIQNGAPDGVALYEGATLIEFLSYEGSFVANGASSVDIGVSEGSSTAIGDSLQRTGSGTLGADFQWTGPQVDSPGALNEGQTFETGDPAIGLAIAPGSVAESDGAMAAVGMLTLLPPPASPVNVSLTVDVEGEVSVPASVSVGVSGAASFNIGALEDGFGDGDRVVEISATAPGYLPAAGSVTVFDIDPPPGRGAAFRVATYNIENGVGQPGDPGYEAALRVLRRIGSDAVCFTEVDPDNGFGQLKTFLSELGMATDNDHLATFGDAFAGQSFDEGDFGSGQAIAFASRYPITAAVQIGRDQPGRRELTRFPLFVGVDVPGVANDPSFACLHFKAGGTQADIFRRAIEGYRVQQFIAARGLSGSSDNIFILGDVNEDFEDFLPNSVFTGINPMIHVFGDGSTFPGSYLLGSDLAAPGMNLGYDEFPKPAFATNGVRVIDSRQLDGGRRTYNVIGDARLDYVMASDFTMANALPMTEVYNSVFEFGNDGLPKLGAVPFGADSYVGSDHHLVFGDFALEPAGQIVVEVATSAVEEGSVPPVAGTVEIIPPAASDTEVRLLVSSGRFSVPEVVTVPAGGSASFSLSLVDPEFAAPDGEMRITGYANGLMPGHDFVTLTSRQATGVLLFSGYTEPPSGGSPKAVEIVNAGGVALDFADTPMQLLVGVNGASPAPSVLTLRTGTLSPGAVFVVGGVTAGNYLVAEGLLADPGAAFSTFETGTPFLNGAGEVVFVYRPFFYNGDDALALQLSYTLSDTFGTVGQDPGARWSGGGVSSANETLALRDDVATGSAGWTDPSQRWVSTGSGLAGFGIPPVLNDPYRVWASGFGLAGAAAGTAEDLEPDGLDNLLEFALGGNPLGAEAGAGPETWVQNVAGTDYLAISFRRLSSPGRVDYSVERAGDLVEWNAASTVQVGGAVPEGAGYERVVWRLQQPVDAKAREFLRLRVTMP